MLHRLRSTTAWCDGLLDTLVVLLASWTVAYHACLVLRLGVPWAWALTAAAGAGWLLLHRVLEPENRPAAASAASEPTVPMSWGRVDVVAVGAALVAAAGMALRAPWTVVWVSWLVAAGAGIAAAWQHRGFAPVAGRGPAVSRWEPPVVLGWAAVMAMVALWTNGPNGDDLFYVNLSQWVATHGEFPLRDTLFGEQTYPMSNWPPVASYDALVGAVAALLGVRAGTVAYLQVPAVASFVAVLVLWRLFRAWRVQPAVLALSVAMVSILVATGAGITPGEALVTRIWQGKLLFAWLLTPWLLVQLLRFHDGPDRRRALWLFTGGVAAVGLSTTGMFVVPVVALAGAAALLRTSWRHALVCFALTAAYPLGAGAVTKALGGRSADLFDDRKLSRFDPELIGHSLFQVGILAFVVVLMVLLAALWLPHPGARMTMGVLAFVLGVVFVPGVTHLSHDLVGLGPTLRRVRHGLVIVALVGAAAVWLGSLVPGRRWVSLGGVAVATSVLFAVVGAPVRTASPSFWQQPLHWQRADADLEVTERILRDAPFEGLVLAPSSLAVTLTVTTTEVKTVAPRAYYLDYLREVPSFHFAERRTLVEFVNSARPWKPGRQPEIDRALKVVDVAVACVYRAARDRDAALRRAGMTPYVATATYRCFRPNR